jgi:hypothetical protein
MRSVVRSLIVAVALAAAALPSGISVAPVAADCGSDGIQWPSTPSDVRGLTFIGTVTGDAPEGPTTGPTLVRFAVEELLDGTAGPEVLLEPWCVGTRFEVGQRYLVSTSDRVPLVGGSPSPVDGHAWFTDGDAVAWRLPGGGKAVLMGYGDGSLRDAPGWLRHAVSRDQAVATVLPDEASPVPAVLTSVEDDTFRLTIMTDHASYTTTDVIPVAAILQLLRDEPTTIAGSGSGPVVFGIEQLDGPVDAGPAWTSDCTYHVWAPKQVEFVPFQKSGGYDASDPMAPFWMAFFNDADLVLPAGHYRIFAMVDYDVDTCEVEEHVLTAEALIDVVDAPPPASPGA